MSASASLIPELEDVIQHGSADRRATTVKRIANLFVDGAASFNEDHIGLFDDVLCRLVDEIEAKARSEMAQSLASLTNAPTELMHTLAKDEDIAVAGPVLSQSPRLRESELVELARTRGQAHLAAIAGRADLGEAVTDVLVRRGNPEVVLTVADNQSAKFSEGGFSALVKRAEGDEDLAQKVGSRPDIPPHLFRELLVRATMVVQQRLLASAKPETRAEIQRVLDKISREYDKSVPVRDYTARDAHRGRDASDQRAWRAGTRRLRQPEEVRRDGVGAGRALRRADRDRRPPDGGRPAGPDPHSLQGRGLQLGDRARDHHVAAERQGHVEPVAR